MEPKCGPVSRIGGRWSGGVATDRAASGVQHDLHAVVGRLDVFGQMRLEDPVVEVDVHVGEDGPLRLHALDPGQGFRQAEMAGVRGAAQRIDNSEIQTL